MTTENKTLIKKLFNETGLTQSPNVEAKNVFNEGI